MSRCVIRPQAERDIDEQCLHLLGENTDLALRFFDAVHATIDRLAETPDLGIAYEFHSPRLQGIRWWKVGRFRNHLIFYRPLDGGIEVIRVLYAARDIPAAFGDDRRQLKGARSAVAPRGLRRYNFGSFPRNKIRSRHA